MNGESYFAFQKPSMEPLSRYQAIGASTNAVSSSAVQNAGMIRRQRRQK